VATTNKKEEDLNICQKATRTHAHDGVLVV